jgi:hypothetical protein
MERKTIMKRSNRVSPIRSYAVVLFVLALPTIAAASLDNLFGGAERDGELDGEKRVAIIETVITQMHEYYNLPEVAAGFLHQEADAGFAIGLKRSSYGCLALRSSVRG